jgi:hypothetical protein
VKHDVGSDQRGLPSSLQPNRGSQCFLAAEGKQYAFVPIAILLAIDVMESNQLVFRVPLDEVEQLELLI